MENSIDTLHAKFLSWCEDGNLESVKDLIENYHINIFVDNGEAFVNASSHLELTKYLLTLGQQRCNDHDVFIRLANLFFYNAVVNQKLDVMKYLLTTSDFGVRPLVDISINNHQPIVYSAMVGNLEVVRYLLTSPDLVVHADIHARHDDAFIKACITGKLEVVEYLLESPELKNHISIYTQNGIGFIHAYHYKRTDIVHYFMYRHGIEATPEIKEYFKKEVDTPLKTEIQQHFSKIELYRTLQGSLGNEKANSLIYKI